MRASTLGLLVCIAGTGAASAQSTVVTTNIERDAEGRVTTITSTSERGTERTDYTSTTPGSLEPAQETKTFEPAERGYNPLGHGGYRPLGR